MTGKMFFVFCLPLQCKIIYKFNAKLRKNPKKRYAFPYFLLYLHQFLTNYTFII